MAPNKEISVSELDDIFTGFDKNSLQHFEEEQLAMGQWHTANVTQ